MESRRTHPDLAGEAWGLLFELMRQERRFVRLIAESFDLSPHQMFLLRSMQPGEQRGMGEFVADWGCDRSMVTRLVDRLVSRGLLERRESPLDRRTKLLLLTDAGNTLRVQINDRMRRAPPSIQRLSTTDQSDLVRIMQSALSEPDVPGVEMLMCADGAGSEG
jgi:DNA-binding MarR family transcriptional regulator